jgi:hypothetical protein
MKDRREFLSTSGRVAGSIVLASGIKDAHHGSSTKINRVLARGLIWPFHRQPSVPGEKPSQWVKTYDFEFQLTSAAELRLEVFRPACPAPSQSQIVLPAYSLAS